MRVEQEDEINEGVNRGGREEDRTTKRRENKGIEIDIAYLEH